jgi:hypothetical protein
MKKLLILVTLLTSASSFAVTILPNTMNLAAASSSQMVEGYAYFTTSEGLVTSTSIASPIAGIVVFADSGTAIIDLENESALEEVELIQIALEDGDELSNFQNAVLEIGVSNGQLDEDANILE